jgi:hypothetical protein
MAALEPIDSIATSHVGVHRLAERFTTELPTPTTLWSTTTDTNTDSEIFDATITLTHALTGPDAEITVQIMEYPFADNAPVYTVFFTNANGLTLPYADRVSANSTTDILTELVLKEFFPAHAPTGLTSLTRLFA